MGSFLYFLPDARPPQTAAQLPPATGLRELLHGAPLQTRVIENNGPGGLAGCVVCPVSPAAPDQKVGVYLSEQTWVEVVDAASVRSATDAGSIGHVTHWLGYETSSLPAPADLVRPEVPPGREIEFADGRLWRVPLLEAYSRDEASGRAILDVSRTALPWVMSLAADGTVSYQRPPQHRPLAEEAAWWHDTFAAGGKYTFARLFQFLLQVLGLSYRIGRAELNALGLVSTSAQKHGEIINAALGVTDYLAELEAQKKTAATLPGT